MSDIWRLSASELAARVRNRSISAGEAARAALARCEKVNPRINAVIQSDPEAVLERAKDLDKRIAAGENVGLLAGVPVTVKVNLDQAGFATTNGVTLQKDLVAKENSPVVDAFLKAGAIIVGRTNTPAFSYRWFTNNLLHGHTYNPRNRALTPGGSSGGAASAVTAGIGHLAHGTDIAGSIRYPAYACGVHGLRPTLGRIAAYNATVGDRAAGPQLTAVSGPIGRSIADLRLALEVLAVKDLRDPWWVPAPLIGPARAKKVALCIAPDAMSVSAEVVAALRDAAARLKDAGYVVEEVANTPAFAEAASLQTKLWLGDGFDAMLAAAEKEGDPGALAALRGQADHVRNLTLHEYSAILLRRATLLRSWEQFLSGYAALLIPVSGEPPFPDDLDLKDASSYQRVWRAQVTQVGLPFMGLPGLTVSTAMNGNVPIGVQLIASRYREDLLLDVGEEIAKRGAPPSPIDPV
jgi:amidase